MNIRCRGPNGSATLSGVEPTLTIADFQELIEQKTLIPVGLQEILSGGFPPEILKLPENPTAATVSELPIKGGDSITVRSKKDSTHSVAPTGAEDVPERNGFQQPLRDTASPANANMSEDEALAKAIRMSMVDGGARDSNSRANQDQTSTAREGSSGKGKAPTSVVLPSGSAVVRRVIDANDSCLFNAVGYVIERSLDKSAQLRRVIADAVAGDPELYNSSFLGKEVEEYCRWIQEPHSWGGAIELSILSGHFQKEIAAYDIQTKRCDVYGEGSGYSERVMLIYDGIHYDALTMKAFEGAPEEIDITIFAHGTPQMEEACSGAEQLVRRCYEAKQFTDTAHFTLRCGVCNIGVRGETEAREHAKSTGHTNFSEYS
uniref:Ubiquitin thioesterase OTU n=2 Tax=Tetraselmis sp. GSL018 TaxID=582737 RepID=A0A061QXM6_9CHLO